MSKIISKKISSEYFNDILLGKKKYEIRLADFSIETGDVIELVEYTSSDPETRKITGRKLEKTITYVKRIFPKEFRISPEELYKKGLMVISFE